MYLFVMSITLLRNKVDGLKCIIPYENKAHSNHTQGRKCPCPPATVFWEFLELKGAICNMLLPACVLRSLIAFVVH